VQFFGNKMYVYTFHGRCTVLSFSINFTTAHKQAVLDLMKHSRYEDFDFMGCKCQPIHLLLVLHMHENVYQKI
jgi:hypothetical protein